MTKRNDETRCDSSERVEAWQLSRSVSLKAKRKGARRREMPPARRDRAKRSEVKNGAKEELSAELPKRLESCIFALVRGRSRPEAFQPRRFRQDLPPDADSCLRVAAQGRRNRPDQKLRTVATNKRKYCTAKQQANNNAKCDYDADEITPYRITT